MRLKNLIDLETVLKKEHTKESLRSFGLQNKSSALEQLKKYIESFNLKEGLEVEKLLNRGSNIAIFIALILGLITGFGLLKFGLGEFVNIIYFIFFAAIIPIIFGVISLFYIFGSPKEALLPSVALQKVVNFFIKKDSIELDKEAIYYYNLKTASLLSLFFSLGLLLALIFVGIGRDLPFGWSTTLNISNEYFYNFIKILAYPVSFFIDVPTLDVIKASQYFSGEFGHKTLANGLNSHTIWWQYLIAITLFYGVIFRAIIYILAKIKFNSVVKKRALEKGALLIEGFNTPIISTHTKSKPQAVQKSKAAVKKVEDVDKTYAILGWGMLEDKIALKADSLALGADKIYSVGGLNSIEDDLNIVESLVDKKVVIFVNSYEAPTLDFIDFLEELCSRAKEVVVILLGANLNDVREADKEIWSDKLAEYNFKNLYIKDLNDT